MKKYLIYIALFVLGIVLGYLFVTIFMEQDSKQIEITKKTNGGVPYEWKYEIEDENIVKFVKKYDVEVGNSEPVEGGPVSINFVFEGKKKGKTKVIFKYVSLTGDNDVVKTETYTLKVDGKKNISLVGTD